MQTGDGEKQQQQAASLDNDVRHSRSPSSSPSTLIHFAKMVERHLDWTSVIRAGSAVVFGLIGYHLRSWFQPTHRGFLCGDASIRLPYRDSTIEHQTIYLVSALTLTGVIFLSEYILNNNNKREEHPRWLKWRWRLKNVQMQRFTSIWLLGVASNMFLVNLVKLSLGSLRPHFIAVCLPSSSDSLGLQDFSNCSSPLHFFDQYTCQGDDQQRLMDARLSFYSGHAASAFFFATFLILYLHARVASAPRFRLFIGLFVVLYALLLGAALYVAASRIFDHKHHGVDVLFGALMGTGIAGTMVFIHHELFFPMNSATSNKGDGEGDDERISKSKPGHKMTTLRRRSDNDNKDKKIDGKNG